LNTVCGNLREHDFADPTELAQALAADVAGRLRNAVAERAQAVLVVSGGTTPRKFLAALAQQEFEWGRVIVTLADERWVPPTDPRSNERLVRETLLTGRAAAATFVPLYTDASDPESSLAEIAGAIDALTLPFDAVGLGLGNDGHCASLFPDGDRFDHACDPANPARVSAMRSPTAGEPRITLTLAALAATRALYLHIEGAEKQTVLARVCAGEGAYARSPLRALLRASRVPMDVYACS
jgi:6-phosphogluconolactonase